MATRAQIQARIASEVTVLDERLIGQEQNINRYRIVHTRVSGINAIGSHVDYWVYDEGGANEQALMSHPDWLDVTIGNRYLDYIGTLGPTEDTLEERYHSINMMEFRYRDSATQADTRRIGVYNSSTDQLDVYDHPPPETIQYWPPGYIRFGYGARNAAIEIDPADGKENAIKLPIFDTKGLEQPQGINFINVPNQSIDIVEGIEVVRVDAAIPLTITGANQGQGTNFFFQWQQNGAWIGIERTSGYVRGDDIYVTFSFHAMLEDVLFGHTEYTLWTWTEGRQGTVTIGMVDVIVEERFYDPALTL